jgi:hypothetical protein
MTKTYTQKDPNQVPVKEFNEWFCENASKELPLKDALDSLTNLRVRPSFNSIHHILDYAKMTRVVILN